MDEICTTCVITLLGLTVVMDYIFSYIKTLKEHADRVLPDRRSVTMTQEFKPYSSLPLLIKTCHRRGAFAMGECPPLFQAKIRRKIKPFSPKLKRTRAGGAQWS